jgi:Ulp1 family protease
VIIVFDSLGLKHVGTIKLLREYLVDEAKSKRQMDIPKEDIAGLHAKVPKQVNYCDCGIFLLHYVEKFLQDPDRYLPDILVLPSPPLLAVVDLRIEFTIRRNRRLRRNYGEVVKSRRRDDGFMS